ncbi:hypothetical protein BDF22DRAFT_773576 [Syncephalis plumigaleata]|nr:hypothetical protein BDF22DRAFT_773576 [Syncephalis plumigaleata]
MLHVSEKKFIVYTLFGNKGGGSCTCRNIKEQPQLSLQQLHYAPSHSSLPGTTTIATTTLTFDMLYHRSLLLITVLISTIVSNVYAAPSDRNGSMPSKYQFGLNAVYNSFIQRHSPNSQNGQQLNKPAHEQNLTPHIPANANPSTPCKYTMSAEERDMGIKSSFMPFP